MSDDLEARVHHAITHNGETYIKLADASVTFSIYRKNIAAQAARIAELESRLQEATRLLLQAHDTIFRLHDNSDVAARNLITKIRVGFSGTTTGWKDE